MQFTYETYKYESAERHAEAERRRVAKTRNQENRTKNNRRSRRS